MVQLRTISAPKKTVDAGKLGFFRYGKINDKMILTNDAGEWHFLTQDDFDVFLKGDLPKDHEDYDTLVEKGFIRDGWDVENTALKVRRKKAFVGQGPHLHIVITTH